MNRKDFSLLAQDGVELYAYEWPSCKTPKAILLILHGMAEHALRYEKFAEYLNDNHYTVYAVDHRGHGKTGNCMGKMGFFAKDDGWSAVTQDILILIRHIQREHPALPFFVLGHSMGSFLARTCMAIPELRFSGVILSGTSAESLTSLRFASRLSKLLCGVNGTETASHFQTFLTLGSFNKHFKPNRTPFDWLSRDTKIVDAYMDDPLCGFTCTHGFYRDLFTGLMKVNQFESLQRIEPKPPLLLISGSCDPVSHLGKDIPAMAKIYQDNGFTNVAYILYNQARHEILNETNREDVMRDILNWIDSNVSNRLNDW